MIFVKCPNDLRPIQSPRDLKGHDCAGQNRSAPEFRQAERQTTRAERRGEPAVPVEHIGETFRMDHLECLAQTCDETDRCGKCRLRLLHGSQSLAEIPVETLAPVVTVDDAPCLVADAGKPEA